MDLLNSVDLNNVDDSTRTSEVDIPSHITPIDETLPLQEKHSKPVCGALAKSTGRPCGNVAGKGTKHVGQGRCRFHGGATPVKSGLFSKIAWSRLGKRMAEVAELPGLQRSGEKLAMLTALFEQSVEQYQEITDAIRAWHRSTSKEFNVLLTTRSIDSFKAARDKLRAAEAARPVTVPDLEALMSLGEKISRMEKRYQQMARVVTREQLQDILEKMGSVVGQYVEDEETKNQIQEGWNNLIVEGR